MIRRERALHLITGKITQHLPLSRKTPPPILTIPNQHVRLSTITYPKHHTAQPSATSSISSRKPFASSERSSESTENIPEILSITGRPIDWRSWDFWVPMAEWFDGIWLAVYIQFSLLFSSMSFFFVDIVSSGICSTHYLLVLSYLILTSCGSKEGQEARSFHSYSGCCR